MKQKVALQYGIASGKRQGVRFRRELRKAGYLVVSDSKVADIIIAHSAGCFWLPEAPTHQKLVLVDPPHWPGRSIRERGKQRLKSNLRFRRHNYKFFYWVRRNLWGIFYSLRDFRRTREIVRLANDYDLAKIIRNHRAILVRNQHDDWLTPQLGTIDRDNPSLIVIELPGDHDNLWAHPKRYVELLNLFN